MPRSRLLLPLLFLVAGFALPARAEDEVAPEAAEITERGRPLARILDLALVPPTAPGPDGRALLLLLDVTPSLQKAEFADAFARAMERQADAFEGTRIGIARVGRPGRPRLRPTADGTRVRQTLREVVAEVDTRFQNVYADVRRVVPTLAREKGRREILLVTYENGDAEDDLEATVRALTRNDVRLSVITREAFLSDTWWAIRRPRGPKGTDFTGPEAAFIELPWGLRYQGLPGNTTVLSGFAMFGLTRLAAASGGRVYLHYPADAVPHVCIARLRGFCPFCAGDHVPPNEVYEAHRLRVFSPLVGSRKEVIARAGRDLYCRAVLRAWETASRSGLVYSRPGLRPTGGGWKGERFPYRGWTGLGASTAFPREADHARRLLKSLDLVIRTLEDGIERGEARGGLAHYRAIADTTRVLLYVTRMNLTLFQAYCREVGPRETTTLGRDVSPPEVPLHPDESRFLYIGYASMSLCHGVAPFRNLRLPGGARTQQALDSLETVYAPFARRYAHTPYLQAVRRSGLARFRLVRGRGYVPPGRRIPPTETEEQVTLPARPTRPGSGAGSGGAGTPTSGG
ncbi:MAG: hypothetical protein ACC662_06905 [Planctomycetota bacterium]